MVLVIPIHKLLLMSIAIISNFKYTSTPKSPFEAIEHLEVIKMHQITATDEITTFTMEFN